MLLLGLLWLLQLVPPVAVAFWLDGRYPQAAPTLLFLLFTPLFRLGEFVMGIVLGLAFSTRQSLYAGDADEGSLTQVLLGVAVCGMVLAGSYGLPHEVIRNGLLAGPYCLLIYALARRPGRLLSSRTLQLGGEISYGVYLLQNPVGHVLYALFRHLPFAWLTGRAKMLLLYPIAWGTYRLIEKPGRNWLLARPLFSRSKPIPTPQPELP